jgi:hypothetical protein
MNYKISQQALILYDLPDYGSSVIGFRLSRTP